MSQDAQRDLQILRVDGGMSRNNLTQFQSDVLGVDCLRPVILKQRLWALFLRVWVLGFGLT